MLLLLWAALRFCTCDGCRSWLKGYIMLCYRVNTCSGPLSDLEYITALQVEPKHPEAGNSLSDCVCAFFRESPCKYSCVSVQCGFDPSTL